MDILAERLRLLRDEKGLSRDKVAKAVGIVSRTYQRYENGEREPEVSVFCKLADFFDVSLDYLAGRTEKKEVVR